MVNARSRDGGGVNTRRHPGTPPSPQLNGDCNIRSTRNSVLRGRNRQSTEDLSSANRINEEDSARRPNRNSRSPARYRADEEAPVEDVPSVRTRRGARQLDIQTMVCEVYI